MEPTSLEKQDCRRRLSSLEGRIITLETQLDERSKVINARFDVKDKEVLQLRDSVEQIINHTAILPSMSKQVEKLVDERKELASNSVRIKFLLSFISGLGLSLIVYFLKTLIGG